MEGQMQMRTYQTKKSEPEFIMAHFHYIVFYIVSTL